MRMLQALRESGVLAVREAREAAAAATDWDTMIQRLTRPGALGAVLGNEIVRRLRGGTAYSAVPYTNADAMRDLQEAEPELAAVMTTDQRTVFLRACSRYAAEQMAAVRALQAADPAAVADHIRGPLGDLAREIVAEYHGGRRPAQPGQPAGDCPGCRLVTEPAAPISPNPTKETPDAKATDPAPASAHPADPAADGPADAGRAAAGQH